jgi:hypothetical protein
MRSFLIEQRKLVVLLVMIALWLSLFPLWVRWVTEKPLDEVITLSPRGTISKEVRVVIPENYELNLVFERANLPFEQLNSLLGDWAYKDGKPIPSGVRVPIHWVLAELPSGSTAASGEIDSFGSIAWSAAEVDRQVGHIKVVPGRYLFTAEILRDVPELAHIKTRLSMQLHSKSSSTWQITLVWWGGIVNIIAVWPAAIVIALVLLRRAGQTFRSKGRAASGTSLS